METNVNSARCLVLTVKDGAMLEEKLKRARRGRIAKRALIKLIEEGINEYRKQTVG